MTDIAIENHQFDRKNHVEMTDIAIENHHFDRTIMDNHGKSIYKWSIAAIANVVFPDFFLWDHHGSSSMNCESVVQMG